MATQEKKQARIKGHAKKKQSDTSRMFEKETCKSKSLRSDALSREGAVDVSLHCTKAKSGILYLNHVY